MEGKKTSVLLNSSGFYNINVLSSLGHGLWNAVILIQLMQNNPSCPLLPLEQTAREATLLLKREIKLENRLSKAALIFLQMEIFLVCSYIVIQLRIRVTDLEVYLSDLQECTIKSVWKVKFPGTVINIVLPKVVASSILWNKLVYQKLLYAEMSINQLRLNCIC